MTQYIPKAAAVEEINRRIASLESIGSENYLHDNCPKQYAMLVTLKSLKFNIDTLEVKKVDLEKDVESYWKQCDLTWCRDAYSMTHVRSMLSDFAKHFFELGLKAQKGE